MQTRLRQLVVMTADLTSTIDHARDVLAAGDADIDPEMEALGLQHEVLQIGAGSYIEICTPIDPADETPGSKFLRRGGDGGYMLVLEVDSADALRTRLEAAGSKIPLQQTYHDNELTQLHPREFGTLVEADEMRNGNDWHYPVLEPHPTVGVATGIIAAELAVADVTATVERWVATFDAVPVDETSVWLTGGGVVRFVESTDGRYGPVSIDLEASCPDVIGRTDTIAGVAVRFR